MRSLRECQRFVVGGRTYFAEQRADRPELFSIRPDSYYGPIVAETIVPGQRAVNETVHALRATCDRRGWTQDVIEAND